VGQVGLALAKFYNGTSLSKIREEIDLQFHTRPSDGTIYPWIQRWTKVAIDRTKNLKPKVGDEWLADETVLQIGGKNVWFWDVMDSKTRFLLASHMSVTRSSRDAQALMEDAAKRAGKAPTVVIPDKLLAYVDGIERAFGSDTAHIQSQGFTVQPNTNLIERLHGSIKDRTKIMRGLKSIPSAYLFMDGWATHYNFFRTHDTLGKTPAEEAGVTCPFGNWIDVAKEGDKPSVTSRADVSRTERELVFAKPHKGRKHAQQNVKPRLSRMG
jgi:putative transposase